MIDPDEYVADRDVYSHRAHALNTLAITADITTDEEVKKRMLAMMDQIINSFKAPKVASNLNDVMTFKNFKKYQNDNDPKDAA
jgi:hypothetical protein